MKRQTNKARPPRLSKFRLAMAGREATMKTKGHIVALLIMPLFLFIISCGGAGGSDLAKALEEEI